MGGIVRPLVDVQYVLHRTDELGISFRGNTPLHFQPRLEFVFLSTCRTVSCDTMSTYASSTSRSAKSRKVPRLRPTGGVLQANASKYASCCPSSFGRL